MKRRNRDILGCYCGRRQFAARLRDSLRYCLHILVLAGYSLSVSGQGAGDGAEVEIHSLQFKPQLIHENQPFTVEISGHRVAGFSDQVASDPEDQILEIVGNEVRLSTLEPLECGSPRPPIPDSTLPQRRTFQLPGLPQGDYVLVVNHNVFCNTQFDSFQAPLRVYERNQTLLANLEAPAEGQTVSGVGLIRGWACYQKEDRLPHEGSVIGNIAFSIDEGAKFPMGIGTLREDTSVVCGEGNIHTGYGAVVYWGNFGQGTHTFELYIDDELVDQHNFTIAVPAEGFLTGIESIYSLPEFPGTGKAVEIEWSQSDQNFIITSFD